MANIQFGSYTSQKTEVSDNDFVPIVSLNRSWGLIGCELSSTPMIKKTKLSDSIDADKRNQPLEEIVFRESYMIVQLNVKQGSKKANDNEGYITIKSDTLKFVGKDNNLKNAVSEIKLTQSYGSQINLKIFAEHVRDNQACYIDFFADDNDLFFYSLKNVYCGRISLTYKEPLFPKIYKNYPKPYTIKPCTDGHYNQCAIRMSMALINSGIPLNGVVNYTNPKGNSYCTHKHVLGAFNLKKHIDKLNFWQKRMQFNGTKEDVYSKVINKTGILYFENFEEEVNERMQRGSENRHIEVWNGSRLISKFDSQMFNATEIIFWEIK